MDYSVYSGSRYFHAVGFPLHGDSTSVGKHPFVHAVVQVAPGVTAVGYFTHGLTNQGFDLNRQSWTGTACECEWGLGSLDHTVGFERRSGA